MDVAAAALNAAAVESATQAMLAAGFGHWEEVDENGAVQAVPHAYGAAAAQQFHLAAAHTATAASSLQALPSSEFFASLRVGEGVDALDLIGMPQWRHAVILDSRLEENEFFIRWAGWDPKWDEWVHCLRLAPAHTKVLGDTGPEESSEKTLVGVIGGEWRRFLEVNPRLLADVHLRHSGVAPWTKDATTTRSPHETGEDLMSEREEKKTASYATTPLTTPSRVRHAAPLSPPGSAPTAAAAARSLDPDEAAAESDAEHEELLAHGLAFSPRSAVASPANRSTTAATTATTSSSATTRGLPRLTLHAHECFLRARCPRVFKFMRRAGDLVDDGHDAGAGVYPASSVSPWLDESELKAGLGEKIKHLTGSPTMPATTTRTTPTRTTATTGTPVSSTARLAKAPPSATLPRSSQTGSQSARGGTVRQSASSASLASRKSGGGVASSSRATGGAMPSTPPRSSSSSTPASPAGTLTHSASAHSVLRRSLGATAPTSTTPARSGASSRVSTPSTSAPGTPRRKGLTGASAAGSSPTAAVGSSTRSPAGGSSSAARGGKFAHVKSRLSTGRSASAAALNQALAVESAAATPAPVPSAPADEAITNTTESSSLDAPASSTPSDALSVVTPLALTADATTTSATVALSAVAPSSEECKEQPDSGICAPDCASRAHKATRRREPAPAKVLVLPLSSSRSLHAFLEYTYSDNIAHAAAGGGAAATRSRTSSGASAAAAARAMSGSNANTPAKKPRSTTARAATAQRVRRDLSLEEDWVSSSDDDGGVSGGVSVAASPDGSLTVLDLLELACLGSSLHDARLVCLAAAHLQRRLRVGNVLACLQALEALGALAHLRQAEGRHRHATLSVHLNGCLAPARTDHATHPVPRGSRAAPSPSSPHEAEGLAACVAVPASYLTPDTPSTFLRSGLNLCGVSNHDLDLVTRVVLEFVSLQWAAIFGPTPEGAANMRRLHALPFAAFHLVVSLRSGAGVGDAATGAAADGTHRSSASGASSSAYMFKSAEEKAVYNQAQINAALIAAGIQPAPHHNLFAHAASVVAAAGGATQPSHADLLLLVASPTITLPPCGLMRALRRLYDAPRDRRTCDVRLVIEDDSVPAPPSGKRRPIKSTLWAHKVVLACGSDFFLSYFGGRSSRAAGVIGAPSVAAGTAGWDRSIDDETDAEEECDADGHSLAGVSTIYFPSSSYTAASLDAVLRYIYYNESRGAHIDFATALRCVTSHVTNYFGLREYGGGAHSPPTAAGAQSVPASFVSDLEKSCVHILHTSLSASAAAAATSVAPVLSPLAGDALSLVHAAYAYGDRALFEKATHFLDWTHLHVLWNAADARRREEQREERLARARRRAMRDDDRRRAWQVRTADEDAESSSLESGSDSDEDESHHLQSLHAPADGLLLPSANPTRASEPSSAAQLEFIGAIIAEKSRTAAAAAKR